MDTLSCLDGRNIAAAAAAAALDRDIRSGCRLGGNVGGGGGSGGRDGWSGGGRYVEGLESGSVVIVGHQSGIRHERLRVFEHLAVERMVQGRDGNRRLAGLHDCLGERCQCGRSFDQVALTELGSKVVERGLGRVRGQGGLRRQRGHGRVVVELVCVQRRGGVGWVIQQRKLSVERVVRDNLYGI